MDRESTGTRPLCKMTCKASWQSGANLQCVQDDAAMARLIQLLLDAPLSEHGPVFQDAAWTLLAGALSLLQSTDAVSKQQKVSTFLNEY